MSDVTILSGEANSAEIVNPGYAKIAEVFAPTTLAETTTLESSPTLGGTYRTLQSGGANVSLAANTATVVYPAPMFLRIKLGSNAAENRTFSVVWRA